MFCHTELYHLPMDALYYLTYKESDVLNKKERDIVDTFEQDVKNSIANWTGVDKVRETPITWEVYDHGEDFRKYHDLQPYGWLADGVYKVAAHIFYTK